MDGNLMRSVLRDFLDTRIVDYSPAKLIELRGKGDNSQFGQDHVLVNSVFAGKTYAIPDGG